MISNESLSARDSNGKGQGIWDQDLLFKDQIVCYQKFAFFIFLLFFLVVLGTQPSYLNIEGSISPLQANYV